MSLCGSVMFQAKAPLLKHKLSRMDCINNPIEEYVPLKGEVFKKCYRQGDFSQREMAGVLSDHQGYPNVRGTVTSYRNGYSLIAKSTGADSAGENLTQTFPENVSMMNKVDLAFQEAKLVEGKNAVETLKRSGENRPDMANPTSQDDEPSISNEDYLDSAAPLFSFGVITDVQYADIDDGRSFLGTPRFYRHAIEAQQRAVTSWNNNGGLAFAIHFGDIVDGKCPKDKSQVAIAKVLAEFNAFQGGPVYHMIGNHCLYNLPRTQLNRILNIPASVDDRSYYQFTHRTGFRFVVLDTYDISVLGWPKEHLHAQIAADTLNTINPNKDKNSPVGLEGLMGRYVMFGGGLAKEQLAWLEEILQNATAANEKVIICSHLPLHPDASSPSSLCWNFDEVIEILHKYSCVLACLAGHAHRGGYTLDSHGIHHVVLEAILECPPGEDAYGYINVFPDRLSLIGKGRMTSREMYLQHGLQ